MRAEQAPRLARVHVGAGAVGTWDAQRVEADALAAEHPEQVVVGDQKQLGRLGERLVESEQRRVDVAVGAHDREITSVVVDRARGATLGGVGREKAVGVEGQGVGHGVGGGRG